MTEALLQQLAPQVLAALTRRHGQFELCEDAVQEALLAAATQWPADGVPDNPRGWLVAVATRRLIDQVRSESARRTREDSAHALQPPPGAEVFDEDDSLALLVLCCHPALSGPSQLALTLRAVGGLTTAQIAAAFLVPEATMAQRISRAKQTIAKAGGRFEEPADDRIPVVAHALYLLFNEGYTATSGEALQRRALAQEAIRLTRLACRSRPEDGELTALLALMLLTQARSAARERADGSIVPLAEQDRSTWDAGLIAEGTSLAQAALREGALGPYRLQAAIAAVHAEPGPTDWGQILGLYDLLIQLTPTPVVALNRAVALAEVAGPQAGLDALAHLDSQLGHRLPAVRAHLHERAGDRDAAYADFEAAARGTTSRPEQRYLRARAERCREHDRGSDRRVT